MSSGRDIAKAALRAIGADSVVSPAPAESLVAAYEKLIPMLELWRSDGIDIGFVPTESPDDDINDPPDARNAIIYNLALEIAPDFDNGQAIVSPDLRRAASTNYNKVKDIYQIVAVPQKVASSTMPLGVGHRSCGGYYHRVFVRRNGTLSN